MIKHRMLATATAGVLFVYYLICGGLTTFFPALGVRLYSLIYHGIDLTALQPVPQSIPEMLLGAGLYAVMGWILVCSVGWLYNKMIKK